MKLTEVVQRFSGAPGEDVEHWLDRFAVAIRVTSDEDEEDEDDNKLEKKMALMMPLLLHGPAYITWKRLSDTDKKDYGAITKALRKVYGKTKTAAWRELKTLKLLPGEPVDVLADQITALLHVVSEGEECSEHITAAFLLDAIPIRIAEQVRLRHGEDMNLEKVVSCVKALLAGSDRNPEMAAGALSGEPVSTRNERRGAKALRCYTCNRPGHTRRNCPAVCFRCNQQGHFQRTCPQNQNSGNGQAEVAMPDRATSADDH